MSSKHVKALMKTLLPEASKSIFGTLDIYPEGLKFATQNPGEQIFIKVRAHVLTNFGWLLNSAVLMFLPLIILLIFNLTDVILLNSKGFQFLGELLTQFIELIFSVPSFFLISFVFVYYSTLITYIFINFVNWYYNIYLVTNERIMHIQMKAFTGKHIAEANLVNIEDITQSVVGFFPIIFGYGDVKAQTEAHKSLFSFRNVPNPTWFRDTLSDLAKLVHIEEP